MSFHTLIAELYLPYDLNSVPVNRSQLFGGQKRVNFQVSDVLDGYKLVLRML